MNTSSEIVNKSKDNRQEHPMSVEPPSPLPAPLLKSAHVETDKLCSSPVDALNTTEHSSPVDSIGPGDSIDPGEKETQSRPQHILPAQEYLVKTIDWYHHERKERSVLRIVTQNENGPCPLVAICNVLLLREQMDILPPDRERVTFEYLVERLGDYLLSHGPPEQQRESMHDSLSRLECMTLIEKEEPAAKEPILSSASPNPLEKDTSDPDGVRSSIADDVLNYRYHLDTALSLLPNLQVGLDVNVGFSFIRDFEATAELALFDLFDVDLVHGWIADPQDESTYNVVKACGSYNAIVDCVVHGDELSSQHDPSQSTPPTQHAERSITKGLIASAFLQDTATQLTYYGLELLVDSLPRNKLCVLFRNNHFSTLYKHPETEGLYTLVTDSGLVKERSFVWESLADIDQGASEFFDGFFKKPSLGGQNQTSSREESDLDLAIALSLQTYPTVGTVGPDSSLGNTRTEQIAIENGKESIHTKRMSRISSNSIESTKKRRDHCIVS